MSLTPFIQRTKARTVAVVGQLIDLVLTGILVVVVACSFAALAAITVTAYRIVRHAL